MKIVYGPKVYPTPIHHENDENNIWGRDWHAQRRGSSCILQYVSGEISDREREVSISVVEFEMLRESPERADELILKHGG